MRSIWLLAVAMAAVIAGQSWAADNDEDWWKTTVVYQIYPRSFQDSDGDGTGDLKGIMSRLEHFKALGVGCLWLSPIFKSPMADFGYDISNFYEIDAIFGTMQDFDALIVRANALGIKIVLDFVPNHSSDECEWFVKSAAKDPEYIDYYMWRDPLGFNETGDPIPPNQWVGVFQELVWTWVESRQQFYYHKYLHKQPDLNYRDQKVRRQMENVLTFWLDKGAHGFRVDTIHTLVEDESFPYVPNGEIDYYTDNQELTWTIVNEWRNLLDQYSTRDGVTRVLMTEAFGSLRDIMKYYGNATHPGAHFTFNFNFIISLSSDSRAGDFVNTINEWMNNMPEGATANWVIGNHDRARVATRYGPDVAVGMAMITLLLPGVGVTYNGEEIGMVNNFDISYEDTQDPQGCNAGPGDYQGRSRDFQRTPFQWDATKNAGFTSGESTWLPIHENFLELNLAAQDSSTDSFSFFNIYKKLIFEARSYEAIKSGSLQVEAVNDDVLAMSREKLNEVSFLVLVNLGANNETVNLMSLFPNIPKDVYVYIGNQASGMMEGYIVQLDQVNLLPRASVVLTDRPLKTSGAT